MEITEQKEYEVALINMDAKYGIQEVFLWMKGNTWGELCNGHTSYIHVTLHTGYRSSAYIKKEGARMMTPLGDYDGTQHYNVKKITDFACEMITKANTTWSTKIEVDTMGIPVVIHEKKAAVE